MCDVYLVCTLAYMIQISTKKIIIFAQAESRW